MKSKIDKSHKTYIRELLQDCIDKKITQKECAILLDIGDRQVRRKCKEFKRNIANALVHKNSGRKPANYIPDRIREHIVECCKTEYCNYGPALVSEEYEIKYQIKLSIETVRQIMIQGTVWSANQKKIKRIHNMRQRVSCYGELVQADGTEYDWFGDGSKYVMLVFIDDATSALLHAVLVKSESRLSYMQAMHDYLQKHGRPMCLYTDKHGVFRVNAASASEDAETQFSRAMAALDIKMIQANSPQGKGRVERANRTLQDRVPKRLKLLGIKTVEEANLYLQNEYIAFYNQKFAVLPDSPINMHRKLAPKHNLDQILALHTKRIISKNHTVQYDKRVIQIIDNSSNLHKKEATIIDKDGVIDSIIVDSKEVSFIIIKRKIKQSEAVDGKFLAEKLRELKKQYGDINQQNTSERFVSMLM